GNVGNVASHPFAVDTTPPELVIEGPSGPTKDPAPQFTLRSSEPASHFECRVDGSAAKACDSPYKTSSLQDGKHTFEARAIDAASNVGGWVARSVTVDTTPPDTVVDGPSGAIDDATPTFTFAVSEPGASFACKLDTGSFAPCSSPFTAGPLTDGPHTFE